MLFNPCLPWHLLIQSCSKSSGLRRHDMFVKWKVSIHFLPSTISYGTFRFSLISAPSPVSSFTLLKRLWPSRQFYRCRWNELSFFSVVLELPIRQIMNQSSAYDVRVVSLRNIFFIPSSFWKHTSHFIMFTILSTIYCNATRLNRKEETLWLLRLYKSFYSNHSILNA